jgi:hypothetical protein
MPVGNVLVGMLLANRIQNAARTVWGMSAIVSVDAVADS